jgi:hypothetical protein
MRHVMKIALLVALTQSLPVAFAQSNNGPNGSTYAAAPASAAQPGNRADNAENCGTPSDFKACPPLPRHPLQTYPGPR